MANRAPGRPGAGCIVATTPRLCLPRFELAGDLPPRRLAGKRRRPRDPLPHAKGSGDGVSLA
jgi:hypothetical protein